MIRKILIPEERFAVIIGKHGDVKRKIEKITKTKIKLDDGIEINGESTDVIIAENIITAIGRGFSPQNAMALVDEEKVLIIIEIAKNEKSLKRIRSRLIGTNGKARRNIEEYTKTNICIYGKTVSIIGNYENAELAREAVEKLIKGLSHKSVYKFLEERKNELKVEK